MKTRANTTNTYRQKYSSNHWDVIARLKQLGVSDLELLRSEAQYLPKVIHDGEVIEAVVAGKSEVGHIMIVATNSRVIVLDCKPLFNNAQDITYHVVAGVTLTHVGPFYTVTLHTRLGDFAVRNISGKSAHAFKDYLDKRVTKLKNGGRYDD